MRCYLRRVVLMFGADARLSCPSSAEDAEASVPAERKDESED